VKSHNRLVRIDKCRKSVGSPAPNGGDFFYNRPLGLPDRVIAQTGRADASSARTSRRRSSRPGDKHEAGSAQAPVLSSRYSQAGTLKPVLSSRYSQAGTLKPVLNDAALNMPLRLSFKHLKDPGNEKGTHSRCCSMWPLLVCMPSHCESMTAGFVRRRCRGERSIAISTIARLIAVFLALAHFAWGRNPQQPISTPVPTQGANDYDVKFTTTGSV
jgi:hypothetical protein